MNDVQRIGFLGTGWIARLRMQDLIASGMVQVTALADPDHAALDQAKQIAPEAATGTDIDWLLEQPLDGIVISTPSALHTEHVIRALKAECAVFCQKPLGRTATETASAIIAARDADLLLDVDFSYRHVKGAVLMKQMITRGEIGRPFAVELTFHNAYGPDKDWYRDYRLSGGGCVIDLGIHLIDYMLWLFPDARITALQSRLFANGKRLTPPIEEVEDFATIQLDMDNGVTARIACSWNLSAGMDCLIRSECYGSDGAVGLMNSAGSFFDLYTEKWNGTHREIIGDVDSSWGGRALVRWVRRLNVYKGYDPEIERTLNVAAIIDEVYGREMSVTGQTIISTLQRAGST